MVITFIAVIVLVVFFGGNLYNYSTNIEKASNYYFAKEYDKAYEIADAKLMHSMLKDYWKKRAEELSQNK